MAEDTAQPGSDLARMVLDQHNVLGFNLELSNNLAEPALAHAPVLDQPWISLGQFEVGGTITVHFPMPSGMFRRFRNGRRVFLDAVRPHMTKRRFRRLRGKVKAAARRARR